MKGRKGISTTRNMTTPKSVRLLLTVVIALSIVGIAALFAPALSNRFVYDDFCTAASVQSQSFGQYILHEYAGWTGRFSYIIVSGLAALAGPRFAALLPFLLVLAWFGALVWCVLPVLKRLSVEPAFLYAAALNSFLLTVLFHSLPNFFESVIWETGAINYTLPLVFFTVVVGLFLRAWFNEQRVPLLPVLLLVLISGGFSEVFGLIQIVLFACLCVFLFLNKTQGTKRQFSFSVFAAFITAVLVFLVVYAAPGNAVRQAASSHPEPAAFAQLPWLILRATLVEFYSYLIHARFWILPHFFLPFAFGFSWNALSQTPEKSSQENPKKLFRAILWIGLSTFGLAVVAAFPSAYIQWDAPVARSMILFFAFFIPAAGICSYFLGRMVAAAKNKKNPTKCFDIQAKALLTLAILLFTAGVGASAVTSIQLLPIQQEYARDWDARDEELRALKEQGELHAQIPALSNAYGYSDLDENSNHWVNRCAARYYGFETLERKN